MAQQVTEVVGGGLAIERLCGWDVPVVVMCVCMCVGMWRAEDVEEHLMCKLKTRPTLV